MSYLNSSFDLSRHAKERMNQRSIKQEALDLLLTFGDCFPTRNGCELFALRKSTAHDLKANGHQPDAIRIAQKIAAIVSSQGRVVTSYFHSRSTMKTLKRAA
jgi:hypothetical protein